MHRDIQYRVALGVILAALAVVRLRGHAQTRKSTGIQWHEGKLNMTLRALGGLAAFTLLTIYMEAPERIEWASVPLPDAIRWMGAALGAGGVALLAWVHQELGRNFSSTLHVRAGHMLITSGPYRRVRHPMYTALYLVLASFCLITANWLITVAFLGGFTLLIVTRVPKEEALMEKTFGQDYRDWAAHTGRFLPRFR
jgi:protein-S-isoprenylcysteine O-methyltransferase Ste14